MAEAAADGSRIRRQDCHARLDHYAEAEALVEPAWAKIAVGGDPDIRRNVGAQADRSRGERATEAGAAALGMHEHLAHLTAAVVRLYLSEADRATLVHRRYDPHLSEFGHLSRLGVERLRLGMFTEILPMPEVAELPHHVVVDLDKLAAKLWKRAAVMQEEDKRVGHPAPLAELAHQPVGHGDHPLDKAVSTAGELTVGRRDHLTGLHRPVQPDAVVLPEVRVARAAEHHPVRERPRLVADPLLPREMPASKPRLGRDLRHCQAPNLIATARHRRRPYRAQWTPELTNRRGQSCERRRYRLQGDPTPTRPCAPAAHAVLLTPRGSGRAAATRAAPRAS